MVFYIRFQYSEPFYFFIPVFLLVVGIRIVGKMERWVEWAGEGKIKQDVSQQANNEDIISSSFDVNYTLGRILAGNLHEKPLCHQKWERLAIMVI